MPKRRMQKKIKIVLKFSEIHENLVVIVVATAESTKCL